MEIVSTDQLMLPSETFGDSIMMMGLALRLSVEMEQALNDYKAKNPRVDVSVQEKRVKDCLELSKYINTLDSRIRYWKEYFLKSQSELMQTQLILSSKVEELEKLKASLNWEP